MLILTELENKYKLDLAMIVMKVMIKNINIKNLTAYFISECGLTRELAEELTRELKEKIFIGVAEYLGITADIRALDLEKDIKIVISEAGLTLASSELINRFKNILALYLKGIRAKIDTREVLAREVISGGVNLSSGEIDRVFKVCDNQKFKSLDVVAASSIKPNPLIISSSSISPLASASRLDKIINSSEGLGAATKMADYNLKDVIARGQIKKPVPLNLPVEEKKLSLPAEEKVLRLEEALNIQETPKEVKQAPAPIIAPASTKTSAPISAPVTPVKPAAFKPIVKDKIIDKPQAVVKEAATSGGIFNKLSNLFSKSSTKVNSPVAAPISVAAASAVAPSVTASASTLAAAAKVTPPISTAPIKTPVAPQAASAKNPVKPVVLTNPVAARSNIEADPKHPSMHDIKPIPKVMGPIEELQFFDIINFRRLSKDPVEATTKIFNKIKFLEKEGYDKMVSGVKAWRQSPVNRLYVKIGQEAISKGMTIKDAAIDHQKNNPEYLKIEEIEAIVNLNSKLVF
jgi:hypothetical protein